MSTPQGPDREGRHGAEGEQTGELPTWGTPPPGGWGQSEPDAPGTGQDSYDAPYGAHGGAEATGGWAPTGGAGSTGVWEQTGGAGSTGAWAPAGGAQESGGWAPAGEGTGGWQAPTGGRRRAEEPAPDQGWAEPDGGDWDPSPWDQPPGPRSDVPAAPQPVWGDEATVAAPAGGRRRARDDDEPASGAASGVWGPTDNGVVPGEEPWAPDDVVRRPKRGPFGLGAGALAGIGAGILVVAVLLVLAFVAPGFAVTRTLDKTALQNGVNQILSQNYRLQVGAIDCPDDVEVTTGTTFECQAVVDGEQLAVPGRVITDDGAYQVGRV